MEWSAEVRVGTPFNVRLLLPFPTACHPWTYKSSVSADESAVTFEPYFLVEKGEPVCLPAENVPASALVPNILLDTLSTAPGLFSTSERTFEMRATTDVSAPIPSPSANSPVRTFGSVVVRLTDPDTSRHNAAGIVTLQFDIEGCARVQPGGSFNPEVALVLEDQADTTGLSYAFVRGYIHDAVTPVCGETRVFHLTSRT
jgi:hypothetical protein